MVHGAVVGYRVPSNVPSKKVDAVVLKVQLIHSYATALNYSLSPGMTWTCLANNGPACLSVRNIKKGSYQLGCLWGRLTKDMPTFKTSADASANRISPKCFCVQEHSSTITQNYKNHLFAGFFGMRQQLQTSKLHAKPESSTGTQANINRSFAILFMSKWTLQWLHETLPTSFVGRLSIAQQARSWN